MLVHLPEQTERRVELAAGYGGSFASFRLSCSKVFGFSV